MPTRPHARGLRGVSGLSYRFAQTCWLACAHEPTHPHGTLHASGNNSYATLRIARAQSLAPRE